MFILVCFLGKRERKEFESKCVLFEIIIRRDRMEGYFGFFEDIRFWGLFMGKLLGKGSIIEEGFVFVFWIWDKK